MGTDGYFYYYETSCCLSPEHIGVLITFQPIQTCECGVSCGNMSAPTPTYVFAGEPTHPSPLAPSKTAYGDTLIFSRLSSRGLNNLNADPNANPPSLLQPLKGPKGVYLIKIKDDRLKDKWYLLFSSKSDNTEHTHYFARPYRDKGEDDDLFGKDYDRIQNDATPKKLERSKKYKAVPGPEEPGPLFKVVLEISDIPGSNGKLFEKDFHVTLFDGFGP